MSLIFRSFFVFLFIFITIGGAQTPNSSNLRTIRVGKEAAQILDTRYGWDRTPGTKGTFDYRLTDEQVETLGQTLHEERGRCGGFKDITFGDFTAPVQKFEAPKQITGFASSMTSRFVENVSEEKIRATIEKLSSFPTRKYSSDTGKQAAVWLKEQIEKMAQEYGRKDVTVELVDHSSRRSGWQMPSVIARIEGTDLSKESVIIGGHLDSINQSFFGDKSAPGADDDASGTATALESFRVVMESKAKPRRTIEFMAYSAEEVGLWGSQEISKSYQKAGKTVKAVLQFDMVLYPEPDGKLYLINDFVDSTLTNYIKGLGEKIGLEMGTTKCGYACSDHASWTSAGYPSAFPFEASFNGSNPKIHSSGDTLENAPHVDHAVKFAKLGAAFLWELGVAQAEVPSS